MKVGAGRRSLGTSVFFALPGRINVSTNKEREKDVKKAIKKTMLELFPDAWHIMVVPTGYGVNGIPDHLFCVPITITQGMVGKELGIFIAIEAKSPIGKLSPLQRIQINKILKAKGHAQVVRGTKEIGKMKRQIIQQYDLFH